jgi:hypothetical protein
MLFKLLEIFKSQSNFFIIGFLLWIFLM